MHATKGQMRRHSYGLFVGAVSTMFGVPMTVFAYHEWSLIAVYAFAAAMFVASLGFAIRGMETAKDVLWPVGEIALFGGAVSLFRWMCQSG